jgi:hypothetical protein
MPGGFGDPTGNPGGGSSIANVISVGGGAGGYLSTQGGSGGGTPISTNISGSLKGYGGPGLNNAYHNAFGYNNGGSDPAPNSGTGGSGQQGGQNTGGLGGRPGATGIVIVSYRIV